MPKKGAKTKTTGADTKTQVDNIPIEIVCILDRSGSMEAIKRDAIGGVNSFINEQKKHPGEATMTIVLFDNEYSFLCQNKPLNDVQPLDETTYQPRGSTALLDAVGRTISELKTRNPKKAIIMILTDGLENSSREFNKTGIKKLIDECKDRNWFVTYLSANLEAFDDSGSIGIGRSQTGIFTPTGKGFGQTMFSCSLAVDDYRKVVSLGEMASMATYNTKAKRKFDSTTGDNWRDWGNLNTHLIKK